MHGYYSQNLGPTLAAKIEELANRPHEKQIQLYEEIAVARLAALEAIKLASPVLEGREGVTDTLRAMTQELLRAALGQVQNLVEAAARIEKMSEDKISLTVVNLIVTQMTRAVYDVLGDEHIDLAKRIDARLQADVHMPAVDRGGRLDEHAHVAILSKGAELLAQQMDAVTVPPGAVSLVALPSAVQGSNGRTKVGQNGASKAQADTQSPGA